MKPTDFRARRVALMRTEIFQSLQKADIDVILAPAAVRRVARWAAILRRGDLNTGMVSVMIGRVRVSAVLEDGNEVTLTVLGRGEVFGEMSLLDRNSSSARVAAQQYCMLMAVVDAPLLAPLH
jgi:CRP/FNR family cyclic AMP-dependent transcriptional regulator